MGTALGETLQRFSLAPSEEKNRVELAETIGADGRRLLEEVYNESSLPWLRELDAIETLRRVWVQHYHAHEQQTRLPL